MSVYCTLGDVQGMIKSFTISENSTVTAAEVTSEIIPEVCSRIDERLGKYYVTPITGIRALETVNRIAKWYAAAEVVERVYLGQTSSNSAQGATWRSLADKDLQRIVDGEIILSDTTPTGDTPEPISQKISSKLSNPMNQTQRAFTMGQMF